jgi:TM2 domain-containing membrane protein YozV
VQPKMHNPKKASWLAIIPGAGQIYNKKYWKLPIVYVGLGTTGALIYYYSTETYKYRKEYVARVNENDQELNPKLANETTANVLGLRNYYRRNMEISVAACVIVYALSILDASVDAHFFYYDVSDNLSLKVKPKIDYNPMNKSATPCVALVLKF